MLALSTASRHPAIALSIASANFPDERFGGTILLFAVLSAIACLPYINWQRGRIAAAVHPHDRPPATDVAARRGESRLMSTGYLCVTNRPAMAVVVWLAWSSSALAQTAPGAARRE